MKKNRFLAIVLTFALSMNLFMPSVQAAEILVENEVMYETENILEEKDKSETTIGIEERDEAVEIEEIEVNSNEVNRSNLKSTEQNIQFDGGTGTTADPYLISNETQLRAMNNDLKASYRLCNDIDLAGTEQWAPIGGGFVPITASSQEEFSAASKEYGQLYSHLDVKDEYQETYYDENISDYYYMTVFEGDFYGDGHTISNITLVATGYEYYFGFFGYIKDSLIEGLQLENLNLSFNTSNLDKKRKHPVGRVIGGLVGGEAGRDETIRNCSVSGSIKAEHDYWIWVGGIAGGYINCEQCINYASITVNCVGCYQNDVNDESRKGGTISCGGISGINGILQKVVNYGEITCKAGDNINVGGIVGEEVGTGVSVEDAVNFGNINTAFEENQNIWQRTEARIGGIVGLNKESIISRCINYGDIVSDDSETGETLGIVSLGGAESCYNICKRIDMSKIIWNNIEKVNEKKIVDLYSEDGTRNCAIARIGGTTGGNKNCYSWNETLLNGSRVEGQRGEKDIFDGISLTTEELLKMESYPGFDFENTWGISKEAGGAVLKFATTDDEVTDTLEHIKKFFPERDAIDVNVRNEIYTLSLEFDQEITIGNGNIYICDYSNPDPEKCYRKIPSSNKSINGDFDYMEVTEKEKNKLEITFNNQIGTCVPDFGGGQNLKLIPCDTKLCILIDKGLIQYAKSNEEFFMKNKDSWAFTTKWGLNADTDYLPFANSEKNFFTDDEKISNKKYWNISGELGRVLIHNVFNSDDEFISLSKKVFHEEWAGSCHGMSLVTALMYINKIDISSWGVSNASVINCSDISKPKDSIEAFGTRDLINYYQLIQHLDKYPKIVMKNWKFNPNWSKQLKEIVGIAEKIYITKEPFEVSFEMPPKGQHSCLAIGYYKDGADSVIELYDPNSPSGTTKLIIDSANNVTYDDNGTIYEVTGINHITCAELEKFNIDSYAANTLHNSEKNKAVAYTEVDGNMESKQTVLYCENSEKFTISNADHQTFGCDGEEFSGNMQVYSLTSIGEGGSTEYRMEVDASTLFEFKTDVGKKALTVYQDDFYFDISAEGDVESISIIPGKSVFVKGTGAYRYSAHIMPAEINMKLCSVSGNATGDLRATYDDKGQIFIEAESLGAVDVTQYIENDVFKETIPVSGNVITINPGFLEIKGDINADGQINLKDLMLCLHHTSGQSILEADEFTRADINGDGSVTIIDLMKILHYISGVSEQVAMLD